MDRTLIKIWKRRRTNDVPLRARNSELLDFHYWKVVLTLGQRSKCGSRGGDGGPFDPHFVSTRQHPRNLNVLLGALTRPLNIRGTHGRLCWRRPAKAPYFRLCMKIILPGCFFPPAPSAKRSRASSHGEPKRRFAHWSQTSGSSSGYRTGGK